jgi:hypothetical protein
MSELIRLILALLVDLFQSRAGLEAEVLVLRRAAGNLAGSTCGPPPTITALGFAQIQQISHAA